MYESSYENLEAVGRTLHIHGKVFKVLDGARAVKVAGKP